MLPPGGSRGSRVLHHAAPSARVEPHEDAGGRPGADRHAGRPGLHRGVDRRALHGGVGEHPSARPLHRTGPGHDAEHRPGHGRHLHAEPQPLHDRPPRSAARPHGQGQVHVGGRFGRVLGRLRGLRRRPQDRRAQGVDEGRDRPDIAVVERPQAGPLRAQALALQHTGAHRRDRAEVSRQAVHGTPPAHGRRGRIRAVRHAGDGGRAGLAAAQHQPGAHPRGQDALGGRREGCGEGRARRRQVPVAGRPRGLHIGHDGPARAARRSTACSRATSTSTSFAACLWRGCWTL